MRGKGDIEGIRSTNSTTDAAADDVQVIKLLLCIIMVALGLLNILISLLEDVTNSLTMIIYAIINLQTVIGTSRNEQGGHSGRD